MTNQIQLKKIVFFFKNTVIFPSSIIIKRPGIIRRSNMSKQKAFLQLHIAIVVSVQMAIYKSQLTSKVWVKMGLQRAI